MKALQWQEHHSDRVSCWVVEEDVESNGQSLATASACRNESILPMKIGEDSLELHLARDLDGASNTVALTATW